MSLALSVLGLSCYTMVLFSGVYISAIPISPVYVTSIVGAAFGGIAFASGRLKLKGGWSLTLGFLFLYYVVFSQINMELDSSFFNILFSVVYFLLCFEICMNASKKIVLDSAILMIKYSIVLLAIEAIMRLINPSTSGVYVGQLAFYKYKFNSIMYQDSNFVGVFILSLYFFATYLENYQNAHLMKEKMLLLVLCIVTFSRAAILVILAFGFIFGKQINKTLKTLFIFSIGIIAVYVITSYVMYDGSFLSKFMIIERAYVFFSNKASLVQQLFGIGFGNTAEYIGIGSHNFIVTYVLESGLVGIVLLFLFWLAIVFDTNGRSAIIMIPFLVMGFSMAPHFLPYLYCMYAVIIGLEKGGKDDLRKEDANATA